MFYKKPIRPTTFMVVIIFSFWIVSGLSKKKEVNYNSMDDITFNQNIYLHENFKFLYKEISCDINTYITNCSPDEESRPKFTCYRYAIFLGSILMKNCDLITRPLEKVQMNWELWKLEENEMKVKDIIDKTSCFIEEDSLDYGIYKLKLIANVFFQDSNMQTKTTECYFEVVGIGTQTIIYGGYYRSVYYQFDIYLEVLTMLTPGRSASSKTTKVSYWWQCQSWESFCNKFHSSETQRLIKGPFDYYYQPPQYNNRKVVYNYDFYISTQVADLHSSGHTKYKVQTSGMQGIWITTNPGVNIGIICLLNCGGAIFKTNPQDIVHLEAKFNRSILKLIPAKEVKFVWFYEIERGIQTEVPMEARCNDSWTEDSELRIKRDFLKENSKYLFSVTSIHDGKTLQRADIEVFTSPIPSNVTCTLNQNKESIGKMHFYDIFCSHQNQDKEITSVMYEFYNRNNSSENGRHLGFSMTGVLKNVLLTRPQLYVSITNLIGATSITKVNSNNFNQTTFNSEFEIQQEIDTVFGSQGQSLHDYIYRINLISAYCDLLSNSNTASAQFKFDQINSMLVELNFEHIPDITGAIMLHNVLTDIVHIVNKTEPKSFLKSESISIIANLMNSISLSLQEIITNSKKTSRLITTLRVHSIADELLQCSNFVLEVKENYNLVDLNNRNNLKKSISSMTKALKNILISLEFQQSYAINELNIKYKNIWLRALRWVQEEKQSSEKHGDERNRPILKLAPVPKLHLNIITFEINPFWWSNGYEINTHVKIIYLPLRPNQNMIKLLRYKQFSFNLKINNFDMLSISGKVKQPDSHNRPEINDMRVAVHRIKSEDNSLSFINFTYIENDTSLRVVILQGQRPDFDYMNNANYSKIVTTESSVLIFIMQDLKEDEFFYIGILPERDVKVDVVINYNFTIFSAACRIWKYEMWTTTDQCFLNVTSSKSELQCVCPLASKIVAGSVYVPSHQFNPFSDFPLFISNRDYPLIVIILLLIYLLYFLLLIWARKKDKKDKKELNIIVLEDNDPRDSTAYLIGVFTGARLNAGTSSNVGLRLFGDQGFSRSHILNSLLHPTLKSNSDKWFLMFTPHHLGTLTNIIIWTDHSGPQPNWYCSKIMVYDMLCHENDLFFIESWFGNTAQGIHLQSFEECATCSETNKISRIISENLLYGFRETHYWFSVFWKHPRSPVTRTQRLSMVVCGFLVNILVCVLLFYPSSPHSEDFYSFVVIKDTIIISMIGSLSGCVVSFIIMRYLYSCYRLTGSPSSFHTNTDCCDIYHLKRKITPERREPIWLTFLRRHIPQHVKPVKALPLQSLQHCLIGIKINKKKLNALLLSYVAIMVICSHFIIAFGLQYGETKIILMCTSIIFSVFQLNLIVAPIKLFITAILLACTKTRFYELMTFSVELKNILHTLKKKYNKNYKRFLGRLRNLEMYKIPTEFKIQKLSYENQRFVLVLEIYFVIGCITFLCVIIWLIQLFKIKLYYLMNMQTFCTEFGNHDLCKTVYRYDLENVMEFWDSLSSRILPALYSKKWYNGQNNSLPQEMFHDTGWMVNGAFRLIGVPQIRQIRVKPHNVYRYQCHVPEVMKNITKECHIPTIWLSADTEDNTNYGIGWSNNTWFRGLFDASPWKYTEPSLKLGSYLRGPSGHLYHDGGYIANLHRDLVKTKASLSSLFDTNWIDTNSRVIITDFTMYNANKDVFTETNIVTEVLTVGSVKVIYYFNSIMFSSFITAGALFFLMVIVFSLQFICLMNIEGTQKFLGKIWNIYDCLILCVFIYATVFYCSWVLRVTEGREQLSKQGKDVYFSIYETIGFKNRIRNIIGVVFSLMLFRLLRTIRFNEDVRLYAQDLLASRTEIFFACLITAMLMFVQFRFIMFLTVPPPAYSLKDVLILRSQFKNVIRHTYRSSSIGKLLAYILNFTSQLGIFTFMLSQYHHYKKAQETRVHNLKRKQKMAETLLGRLGK